MFSFSIVFVCGGGKFILFTFCLPLHFKIPGSASVTDIIIRLCSSSGDGINKSYFPVLVPVGVIGNILSFLVRLY